MELKLEQLSVEQKIGQLICVRGYVDEDDKKFILDMIKKKSVGAIQMTFREERRAFIKEALAAADYPLLVCADMENGYPGGQIRYPYPLGIASSGDMEFAYNLGRVTAIEAKRDGVNVAWGPVVDVALKDSVCRVGRCFGDDPEYISEFAISMIKGFSDEGMLVTMKHFPDGSDVKIDTHMQVGISHLTKEELLKKDIIPYLRAMEKVQLPGIMTVHKIFEKIDPEFPATMSPEVISIIREAGFDGIIMTDSLAMMAIVQNYGESECCGLSIKAGCDMVLPNYRLSFKESYEYLMDSYKRGVFDEERLNDAVRHVLEAQKKASKPATTSEVPEELKNIVEEAKKKSICFLSSDNKYTPKLDDNTKKLFVMFHENLYDVDGISRELEASYLYSKDSVLEKKEKFIKEFKGSDAVLINEFPNQLEIERVCDEISKYDEVIFYIFCKTSSYLGSDNITKRAESLIKANLDKCAAVIHIGNPYEIEKYKGAKRVINHVYGTDCDDYIIDVLKGNFKPTGKITVDIDF
ncbi:MAG: glycoside hydrolase family 3 protein [Ruminococcaceae bacterium]|nr:glycoside hydrolase family 3 protein [Oscillospiraceae bacterium]